jgi:hypothetical protein
MHRFEQELSLIKYGTSLHLFRSLLMYFNNVCICLYSIDTARLNAVIFKSLLYKLNSSCLADLT